MPPGGGSPSRGVDAVNCTGSYPVASARPRWIDSDVPSVHSAEAAPAPSVTLVEGSMLPPSSTIQLTRTLATGVPDASRTTTTIRCSAGFPGDPLGHPLHP